MREITFENAEVSTKSLRIVLADQRGGGGGRPLSNFFHVHAAFGKNLVGAPPRLGNPGSAPEYFMYLTQDNKNNPVVVVVDKRPEDAERN